MINWFAKWLKKRRAAYASVQADARRLIAHDERGAYYAAQRLRARARARGEIDEVWRWTRVAAEVARTSRVAEMDFEIVKTISDEEIV